MHCSAGWTALISNGETIEGEVVLGQELAADTYCSYVYRCTLLHRNGWFPEKWPIYRSPTRTPTKCIAKHQKNGLCFLNIRCTEFRTYRR